MAVDDCVGASHVDRSIDRLPRLGRIRFGSGLCSLRASGREPPVIRSFVVIIAAAFGLLACHEPPPEPAADAGLLADSDSELDSAVPDISVHDTADSVAAADSVEGGGHDAQDSDILDGSGPDTSAHDVDAADSSTVDTHLNSADTPVADTGSAMDTAAMDTAVADTVISDTTAADTTTIDTAATDTTAVDTFVVDTIDPVTNTPWFTSTAWRSVAIGSHTGPLVVEFDAKVNASPADSVVGLTLGHADAYDDVAMIFRFGPNGAVDVRTGDVYAASVVVPYAAEDIVHVVIASDVSTQTYTVTASVGGNAATVVLGDADFRTSAQVSTIDTLALFGRDDELSVRNLVVNGTPVELVDAPVVDTSLHTIDFAGTPLGEYTDADIEADWPGLMWANPNGRVSVVEENGNRFIRVSYPQGGVGPGEGGAQWRTDFQDGFGTTFEELYVSYRVRFRSGFNPVKGGKLPGLLGGTGNTGGNPSSGYDGWSARMMWRTGNAAVFYVYHADMPGIYGEDLDWANTFTKGDWITVEHRVVMNTGNQHNGVLQGWYNGVLAHSTIDLRYRFVNGFAIDGFYFSTFFGGSGADWAPTVDETIDFDDFIFSTSPITH